jgi:hypothetical protein
MGVAFRQSSVGRSDGDYLSRAIVNRRGAPITNTAFIWSSPPVADARSPGR